MRACERGVAVRADEGVVLAPEAPLTAWVLGCCNTALEVRAEAPAAGSTASVMACSVATGDGERNCAGETPVVLAIAAAPPTQAPAAATNAMAVCPNRFMINPQSS